MILEASKVAAEEADTAEAETAEAETAEAETAESAGSSHKLWDSLNVTKTPPPYPQ